MSDPVSSLDAERIAARHGVPPDAVAALAQALRRGGGRQAQFSHPALGGMGQWSHGSVIMIGDMFNDRLKARVGDLCSELARGIEGETRSAPVEGGSRDWWPAEFGAPASVGRQNEAHYAVFPQARRLVLRTGSTVESYDTGDYRIIGASQDQGPGSRNLAFTSQHGTIRLGDLTRVAPLAADKMTEGPAPRCAAPSCPAGGDTTGKEILGLIERLHDLRRNGVPTAEEFCAKKAELLARL